MYELKHIGINANGIEDVKRMEQFFKNAFHLEIKEGSASDYAGPSIEIMKRASRGCAGHIAMGTDDCERAVVDLKSRGFEVDMSTAKYLPDGTLKVVYLKDELNGFAIHITKNNS